MSSSRVLIVAYRTAVTPSLIRAVAGRAAEGPCEFTLLVPTVPHGLHWAVDPEDQCCEEATETIEAARPALEAAAGGPIAAWIGSHDPLAAVEDALNLQGFDEAIVSAPRRRVSSLLHFDLARRVRRLGIPVVVVGHEAEVRTPMPMTQTAA